MDIWYVALLLVAAALVLTLLFSKKVRLVINISNETPPELNKPEYLVEENSDSKPVNVKFKRNKKSNFLGLGRIVDSSESESGSSIYNRRHFDNLNPTDPMNQMHEYSPHNINKD